MKSSIFLADLTVVDHAYINDRGQVIGGSFNPGFIVTGELDPIEKVVVDFSTIKKDVKHSIDKHIWDIHNNGFDHKIWFIEGISNGTYEYIPYTFGTGTVKFNTPAFQGSVPADAVRIIKATEKDAYGVEFIGDALRQHVYNDLIQKYPNINLQVECHNNVHIHTISKMPHMYFTYSHGLKDSTSYGCQNLVHGHLSTIAYDNTELMEKIISDIDSAVFINRENIVFEDAEKITIEYISNRGYFAGTYIKDLNKIIILDTETTIEYIGEYVRKRYSLTQPCFISVGLSKGAVINT